MSNGRISHRLLRRVSLQDIATVIMGQSPPSSAYNKVGEGLPFFQGKAEFGSVHPTPVKWCSAPTKIAEPEDVLMSVRAPVGPTNLATERCCVGRGLAAIRAEPGVRSKWLLYAFRAMERSIDDLGTGTTFKAISGETLRQLEVPIAGLEDQDRVIAEIEKQFTRLDEAVANLKRVKANVARFVGSVLIDATAGRLVQPSRAVWCTVQVCEAGEVLLGRQRAPQYLTGRWSRKYLRVANIKDDAINFNDVETMDFDEAHFAKYRLAPGDILVCEGQSPELLGQSAIFRGYEEPLCFQKTLHRFRADPEVTTPEFAQIVFRSHVRSGVFRRLGSITTNIGHLTLEKFKAAPFPLPPLDEQRRIVAEVDRRLSIVREVEAEVDANLRRAQALRQAVLATNFSGNAGITRGNGRSD